MGIFNFFNAMADGFRNHYLELARNSAIWPMLPRTEGESEKATQASSDYIDTYQPSSEAAVPSVSADDSTPDAVRASDLLRLDTDEPAADDSDQMPSDENDDTGEVIGQPYRFRHHTHFNYEVRLEFQLRAIAAIAGQIANGEEVAIDELAAAGFGLRAAMDLTGKQAVSVSGQDRAPLEGHIRSSDLLRAKSVQNFSLHSRNLSLESFSRESLRIQRSLDVKSGDAYARAVNKFAIRFKLDNRFSFSFLDRFNVQSERLSESDQASLASYSDSAGNLAERGTSEMMGAFFDAVDAYLDQAEDALLGRANELFDLVAREFGISGEGMAMAREHMVSSVQSFFERVDMGVAGLEARFTPSTPESPPANAAPPVPSLEGYVRSSQERLPRNIAVA